MSVACKDSFTRNVSTCRTRHACPQIQRPKEALTENICLGTGCSALQQFNEVGRNCVGSGTRCCVCSVDYHEEMFCLDHPAAHPPPATLSQQQTPGGENRTSLIATPMPTRPSRAITNQAAGSAPRVCTHATGHPCQSNLQLNLSTTSTIPRLKSSPFPTKTSLQQ